jgi:hypothetical protein
MLLLAAAPPVSFAAPDARFRPAADEYRRIWEGAGERIVGALEAASGLTFPRERIDVTVSRGRPMTSFDGRSMRLRADYSPDYKKATLVHEMGHRLAFTLKRPEGRDDGLDDHKLLYLFLYDAWSDLYGPDFADRMAAIERRIGPGYDSAWSWALAMTREQRRARLAALRSGASRP